MDLRRVKKLSTIKARTEALERLVSGGSLSVEEQRAWIIETHALNDRVEWQKKQIAALKKDVEAERKRFDSLVKAIKERQGAR